jgi:hypothetical protein
MLMTSHYDSPLARHQPAKVVPHSPFRIPHSAFGIPHSAFAIPHSAFRIPHSAFPIPHSAFRMCRAPARNWIWRAPFEYHRALIGMNNPAKLQVNL